MNLRTVPDNDLRTQDTLSALATLPLALACDYSGSSGLRLMDKSEVGRPSFVQVTKAVLLLLLSVPPPLFVSSSFSLSLYPFCFKS